MLLFIETTCVKHYMNSQHEMLLQSVCRERRYNMDIYTW